ncbi:hypothetical protein KKH23_08080 [Patescibacteria group bacterium]|nr:hypothetical protein [Patescibacteria group bacterium]
MTEEESARIEVAIDIAIVYGDSGGAHHKAWVIDQMVRALTGGEVIGDKASFYEISETDEYRQLVASARDGVDGPETYGWDTGIAP